ncbi:DUF4326 domain-containing protein [Streptomyces sp. ME19-01-6]|uniref:DUF4326 domain-containing protein n=1 Tax=Streptomyces sp. ME19-01-6 TaxID=3028686 RepID=UPI0029A720C0|nr:DUF4326 domain-containing protein [Streptomyces sp. ME19-01-6]MDX3230537.1 DUF4326 domain-containing protein [Streptomyces sp. ME19-01-6]
MNAPTRIQRKRTPGWRLPPNAVIVDRTSRYGNPFRVEDAIEAEYSNPRRACVSHYRAWLEGSTEYPDTFIAGGKTFDRRRVLADIHLLRGQDLACPCPLPTEPGEPDYCHAAVLLELAARKTAEVAA